MKFNLTPGYTINRGGDKLIADEKGVLITDNEEVIEALTYLFPVKKVINKTVQNENIKKGS